MVLWRFQFGYQNQNQTQTAAGVVVPGGVDANVRDALLGATMTSEAFKLHGAYGQRRLTPAPQLAMLLRLRQIKQSVAT